MEGVSKDPSFGLTEGFSVLLWPRRWGAGRDMGVCLMGESGVSRRDFLRIGGGAGVGLVFIGQVGGELFRVPVAAAQIPGGTLDPTTVPKYVTPMLIPPVMPRAGTITAPGGKPVDYYEISMKQFAAADPAGGLAGHDGVGLWRDTRRRATGGCCCTTPRR